MIESTSTIIENTTPVQTDRLQGALDYVIYEHFHWDVLVLQCLPVLLLVCSLYFFSRALTRKEKHKTAQHYSRIMLGLAIAAFHVELFCLSLAIARTLIENSDSSKGIPIAVTGYLVGFLLRLFVVILPVTGLTCLGGAYLSRIGNKRQIIE